MGELSEADLSKGWPTCWAMLPELRSLSAPRSPFIVSLSSPTPPGADRPLVLTPPPLSLLSSLLTSLDKRTSSSSSRGHRTLESYIATTGETKGQCRFCTLPYITYLFLRILSNCLYWDGPMICLNIFFLFKIQSKRLYWPTKYISIKRFFYRWFDFLFWNKAWKLFPPTIPLTVPQSLSEIQNPPSNL